MENETMELFSISVRNKDKHGFAGTKVPETEEGERIFRSLYSK